LNRHRTITVYDKGHTVEHKLVLPAKLVHIEKRQAGFRNAGGGVFHTVVDFVGLKR